MSAMDNHKEKRRLVDFYASLTDGELQRLAEDVSSLTDVARRALQEEIGRRNIEAEPENTPDPAEDVEPQSLVTIRKFRGLPEALLAKGSLTSAGIECYLADDNMVRMDWFISNLLGGVKLMVKPEDAESAVEMLEQPIPETLSVEGIGEYQQPHCPHCESRDITFAELNKPVS